MLISALRALRGYVEFEIFGAYPQRLLNRMLDQGISVWNVVPANQGFTARMYAKDYKRIHALSKGCILLSKVEQRIGIPFFLRKFRKRWGLFAGLLSILLLFLVLGQMIWLVEVNGGEDIDHQEIKDHLQHLGLYPGSFRRSLNIPELERALMLREGRIGWVAINVKGGRVEVELHQRIIPPEAIDVSGMATNVIASDTGYIVDMTVYEGQPVVKVGDAVTKGDIMISGVTLDKHGKTQLKQARASVIGQVLARLEIEIPFEQQRIEPAGEGISYKTLVCFGIHIPIAGARRTFEDYVIEVVEEPLLFNGKIMLETKKLTPVSQKTVILTEEEAEGIAMTRLQEKERNVFSESEIVDNEYILQPTEDGILLIGEYTIEKELATLSEIMTE